MQHFECSENKLKEKTMKNNPEYLYKIQALAVEYGLPYSIERKYGQQKEISVDLGLPPFPQNVKKFMGKMALMEKYKDIFNQYIALKKEYPYENKTDLIKRMCGENAPHSKIQHIDNILYRNFNEFGNRYAQQAALEKQVFAMYREYAEKNNGNIRRTAKDISGSLNVGLRRVLNILYRHGYFGNFANSKGVKKVEQRKPTGKSRQSLAYQNDVQQWNALFKDDIMQFSPAWYGKKQPIQAA